mgnify:CR=1 FL=1
MLFLNFKQKKLGKLCVRARKIKLFIVEEGSSINLEIPTG